MRATILHPEFESEVDTCLKKAFDLDDNNLGDDVCLSDTIEVSESEVLLFLFHVYQSIYEIVGQHIEQVDHKIFMSDLAEGCGLQINCKAGMGGVQVVLDKITKTRNKLSFLPHPQWRMTKPMSLGRAREIVRQEFAERFADKPAIVEL